MTQLNTPTAATEQVVLEAKGRQIMADALDAIHLRVLEPSPDPDFLIKVSNSKIGDIGKVIPVKVVDPHAGLQVVHITIGRGIHIDAQPLPVLTEVVDTPELPFVPQGPPEGRVAAGLSQVLPPAPASDLDEVFDPLDLLPP